MTTAKDCNGRDIRAMDEVVRLVSERAEFPSGDEVRLVTYVESEDYITVMGDKRLWNSRRFLLAGTQDESSWGPGVCQAMVDANPSSLNASSKHLRRKESHDRNLDQHLSSRSVERHHRMGHSTHCQPNQTGVE